MSPQRTDAGFSLVEALVALAVFAMAGVGLVQLQTSSIETFRRVETRALADAVAQNALTVIVAKREAPLLGGREEGVAFGGRQWVVTTHVAATSDPRTQRVSVSVAPVGEPVAAVGHAFIVTRAAL